MAKKGLRSWVQENWVDIANKKSDGSYPNVVDLVARKEKIILSVYQLRKLEP